MPGVATVCFARCEELWIRFLKKFVSGGTGLDVGAVVDEIPDRDARGELRHAAKMIAVPVSGNQVVDPCEPCVFDGGHDAPASRTAAAPDFRCR
jgi:hypothetical protein